MHLPICACNNPHSRVVTAGRKNFCLLSHIAVLYINANIITSDSGNGPNMKRSIFKKLFLCCYFHVATEVKIITWSLQLFYFSIESDRVKWQDRCHITKIHVLHCFVTTYCVVRQCPSQCRGQSQLFHMGLHYRALDTLCLLFVLAGQTHKVAIQNQQKLLWHLKVQSPVPRFSRCAVLPFFLNTGEVYDGQQLSFSPALPCRRWRSWPGAWCFQLVHQPVCLFWLLIY